MTFGDHALSNRDDSYSCQPPVAFRECKSSFARSSDLEESQFLYGMFSDF